MVMLGFVVVLGSGVHGSDVQLWLPAGPTVRSPRAGHQQVIHKNFEQSAMVYPNVTSSLTLIIIDLPTSGQVTQTTETPSHLSILLYR